MPGCGWTPLSSCTTWTGAQRVASWLVAAAHRGSAGVENAEFWYAAAAKLLAPVLFAAATSDATMADVVRWIDAQEQEEVFAALDAAGDEAAVTAFQASSLRDDRTRSGVYTTAETVLAAYADPGVLASALTSELRAERLLDGGSHTAYLCAPAHEQRRLQPLFATLVQEIVALAYERSAADGRTAHAAAAARARRVREHRTAARARNAGVHRRGARDPTRLRLPRHGADQRGLRTRSRADDRLQPPREGDPLGHRRRTDARLRRPAPRRRGDPADVVDERRRRPPLDDRVRRLPEHRAGERPARDASRATGCSCTATSPRRESACAHGSRIGGSESSPRERYRDEHRRGPHEAFAQASHAPARGAVA